MYIIHRYHNKPGDINQVNTDNKLLLLQEKVQLYKGIGSFMSPRFVKGLKSEINYKIKLKDYLLRNSRLSLNSFSSTVRSFRVSSLSSRSLSFVVRKTTADGFNKSEGHL